MNPMTTIQRKKALNQIKKCLFKLHTVEKISLIHVNSLALGMVIQGLTSVIGEEKTREFVDMALDSVLKPQDEQKTESAE